MSFEKKHVSFSELKVNDECSYRHFIQYELKNRDEESIYAEYGTFLHKAFDLSFQNKSRIHWISFGKNFLSWAKKNKQNIEQLCVDNNITIDIYEWLRDGFALYASIFDFIQEKFPDYELVNTEMELRERIFEDVAQIDGWLFVGYIDLVLKDKDGVYHVIDFKTSQKGWNTYKKSNAVLQYQLALYKKFFAQKQNIPLDNIKTHFVILKRTPIPDEDRIELFTVETPSTKIKNATHWMIQNTKSIQQQVKIKMRGSCKYCPWNKTKLCP